MAQVLIVGAGVIGSAIAWELRRRGAEVAVLESSSEGGQTSAASAGMVNPFSLTPEENPALPFAIASREQFPEWVARLHETTGIDAEWRAEGSLRIALTPEDAEQLQQVARWVIRYEPEARLLSPEEARRLEPVISVACHGALWLPSEGWVHTERLMHALHRALRVSGVVFYLGQPAVGLAREGQRIRGVQTPTGTLYADTVVLCAGAWSGLLLRELGWQAPIEPVRGQILVLRDLPLHSRRLLVSLGSGAIGYLVPRASGEALFGATREQAGYDTRPTAKDTASLLYNLERMFPSLLDATLARVQVGLRPSTPDHQPLIGSLPGWEGFYLASGHSYHGILLAPATAQAVADLIEHGTTRLPIQPFQPERFHTQEVR